MSVDQKRGYNTITGHRLSELEEPLAAFRPVPPCLTSEKTEAQGEEWSHSSRSHKWPLAELSPSNALHTGYTVFNPSPPYLKTPRTGQPQQQRRNKPITFPSAHGSGARKWGWLPGRTSPYPHSPQRACSVWEEAREGKGAVWGQTMTMTGQTAHGDLGGFPICHPRHTTKSSVWCFWGA